MERFLETEKETLKLRLVAALGAVVGLYLHQAQLSLSTALLFSLGYLLYVAYSLALRYYILPRLKSLWVIYGTILIDITALASMLYVARVPDNPLIILFPVFIVYYAIHLGYKGSFFAAGVAGLELGLLLLLSRPDPRQERVLGMEVIVFIIIAAFSGYLGQRGIRDRAEKEVLQGLLSIESGAKSLLEVAKTLNSNLELGPLMDDIAHLVPKITGLPKCIVMLRDESSGHLVGRGTNTDVKELGVSKLDELVEVPGKSSLARRAWEERGPIEYNSFPRTETNGENPSPIASGSVLVIPMFSRGKPMGVIYSFDDRESRTFTESEMRLAQGYGDFSAMAIANAKMYQEAQDKISALVEELGTAVQRFEQMRGSRKRAVIGVNGLSIDTVAQKVTLMGKPVDLSPTEFRLLQSLAEQSGTPLTQDALFRRTWGDVYHGQTNVVDVYIHRLRKKLEDDASSPKRIVTVRGIGYKLSDN